MRSSNSRSSRQEGRPSSDARSAATSTSSRGAAPTGARDALRLRARRSLQRGERACRARRCRWTSSSTAPASADRWCANRTFYFSNFEQRRLDQTGLVTILPQNVAVINAQADAGRVSGWPGDDRRLSESRCTARTSLGKIDHQLSGSDQFTRAVRPLRRDVGQFARRGRANAPSASAGLDNVDHAFAIGNTWTLSPKTVNETRAQFTYGDLEALPTDPIGPAVNIAGVAAFGTLSGSPTAPPQPDVSDRGQPLAPGRRACAARRRRLHLQRRHHHLPARRPRQLHVLVAARLS